MQSGYLIVVYLVYGTVSVALTVWLAVTLFRNGAVFLADVFEDHPELAEATNRLLVVGFFMANLGYAFLLFWRTETPDAVAAAEVLLRRLGLLLVSLAVLHFVNLAVFYRLRRRARLAQIPPPVAPQAAAWAPPPPA